MRVPIFARLRIARGPLIGILVGLAIGVVGYFLVFGASAGASKDVDLLDSAFVADKAALDSVGQDTEVVLEGTLTGNTFVNEYDMVAYVTHRLVERSATSSSDARTHRWEFVSSDFSLLNMAIDGGMVLMTSPDDIVLITGNAEEVIDTSTEMAGRRATFNYNGQQLATGARRIRGVLNGDTITVIGTRTGSGGIYLRRVHAGDRDSFRETLESEASGTGIMGYGALALGVLLIIISVVAILRKKPADAI